jgi:hypothetical protein
MVYTTPLYSEIGKYIAQKLRSFFSVVCVNRDFAMPTDENEEIELNVPESCPKCGQGAFYRMSPDEP